jgi:hypothetical protein
MKGIREGRRKEGVTGMREGGGRKEGTCPRPAVGANREQVTGRYARHADMLCCFLMPTSVVSHPRDALPFGLGPSWPWCPIIRGWGGGNRGLGEAFEAWARHGQVEKRAGIELTVARRCG